MLKNIIWKIPTQENEIFLTFDDGPNPDTTEFILDCLNKNEVKATFFCIGKNVERYPKLFELIVNQGHAIGNHTYSHLKGWKCSTKEYIDDITLASDYISSTLFRPPYGQISIYQAKKLQKIYKIIFWTVLSWDFKKNLNPDKCLENTILKTKKGNIIVFHDSVKTFPKVQYVLPLYISKIKDLGFNFGIIK